MSFDRLHHVGVTVADLGGMLAFFRGLFGIEPVLRGVGEGPEVGRSVGLDDVRIEYAFLDLGNTRLELLQYDRPAGRPPANLRSCDAGAIHLSFEVPDVFGTHRSLAEQGFRFLSHPIELDESHGALAGLRYVYLAGPEGLVVQLYEPATSRA